MPKDTIHIAVASDDNYIRGLITTVYSLLTHCRIPSNVVVHVLDGGITHKHKDLIKHIVDGFNATVDFKTIDQNIFANLAPWHGTGKMAYARLMAPELFPNIEHIIYCDIDIVWLIDVADLWGLRSNQFSLQYVRDTTRRFWHNHDEDIWLEKNKLSLNRDKYFCSGLLLINLENFRRKNLHRTILKLLYDTNGSAPYPDQTALNIVFSGRDDVAELDSKWQTMTSDKVALSKGLSVVLHYAGDCPWKPLRQTNHLLSDLHILWHRTYAHIMGMTTWQSLRINNAPIEIVCARLLYLAICHSVVVKGLIRLYLRIHQKESYFLESIFRIKYRT